MEIFREGPLSFNIERKSLLATRLKYSISRKLLYFLGDYTDDILAEYVTVLVCNRKDQFQAKEDLEAFLGERSGAFVSWLWDHLFQYEDASPSSSGANMDLRSNRSDEIRAHGNAYTGSPLTRNGKYFHKSSRVSPDNRELYEMTENRKKPLETNMEHSQKYSSFSRKAVDIAEKFGGKAGSFEQVDESKSSKRGLDYKVTDYPRRDMDSKNLESSSMETERKQDPHGKNTYDSNISARNPLSTFSEMLCPRKKPRGSVWDRLGKPHDENSGVNNKSLGAYAGDIMNKHYEAEDRSNLLLPSRKENFDGYMKHGVHDKSSKEQKASTIIKPYPKDNIRLKRTYSEFCPKISPSASGDKDCVVANFEEKSHDSKKLNSSTDAVAPVTLTKMKDVKQKLQKIEMEISKLRSKQLGISSEGRPPVLSSTGVSEDSMGDANSRTVFVSNVHFAVTKEVLSSHFAKCGMVSDVIFADDVKGSAYITFASKDSVEKALALNGTSFFSRLLKVVKKGEEATLTKTKPPRCGKINLEKPFNIPRAHHPLQWRRGAVSSPSKST